MMAGGIRRYRAVGLAAASALTCAGDAAATLRMAQAGRSALVRDPSLGWVGRVPSDQGGDLTSLATVVAREAWRAVAGGPGVPALSISASKGDVEGLIRALDGDASRLLPALPDALAPAVARVLGIRMWTGVPIVAACSTGLFALLAVADLVESGVCSHGLVATADRSLHPFLLAGFRNMGVLCGDQPPGVAAGFAPAEGAAAVAVRQGCAPWRLVGGVRAADAGHETHFRDPRTLAMALAALWELLPHPELIVVHGTGTVAGDAYERTALATGPWSAVPRLALKPTIGHCLGASGLVELAVAMDGSSRRLWKLGLGFGGHLAAVALAR